MLDSLLELTLTKKDSIREKLELIKKVYIDSEKYWIDYTSTNVDSSKIISAGEW